LNINIVKVEKNIGGDLTRLKNTFEIAACGGLELGNYCRDRDLAENHWVGLDHLCGKILKHRLPKPKGIHCGD
jgi:hypothetical protein